MREIIINQPPIDIVANFFSVGIAISINMIDAKKFNFNFTATRAFSAVMKNYGIALEPIDLLVSLSTFLDFFRCNVLPSPLRPLPHLILFGGCFSSLSGLYDAKSFSAFGVHCRGNVSF